MVFNFLPNDQVRIPVIIDGIEFSIVVKSDIFASVKFSVLEDCPIISIISND